MHVLVRVRSRVRFEGAGTCREFILRHVMSVCMISKSHGSPVTSEVRIVGGILEVPGSWNLGEERFVHPCRDRTTRTEFGF